MYSSFISYRRDTGGTFAKLLHTKLDSLHFSVFFDGKSMHDGRFDKEIASAIDMAENFIVILSKDALKKRNGTTDYYFEEIKHALKKENGHIIPIILSDFLPPDDIDPEIADILKYQGVHETALQFFDTAFISQLIYYMGDTEDKRAYMQTVENRSFISSRKVLERESIEERWENAVEIDICAHYANMLLNTAYIVDKLEEGVKIRFLVTDPESEAAKEASEYKLKRSRLSKFEQAYEAILELCDDIEYARKNNTEDAILNGEIEFRKTKLHIPFAIMTVKKRILSESTVKVDYYSFGTGDPERRSVIISYADRDNYEFYCEQFEYIWNHGQTKPIIPENI
ncbi:MAG: toll/interleukin-1 receptor domain-containing protein [Clostridia bacterium]|nr:toll/interleukin-1 receptor domain-containing protein [Clostridia bacterium]